MKKLIFTVLTLGSMLNSFAQDLNDYKYVIVPNSYEFMKEKNQYRLNELTEFLFEKYGFEAYMKDEKKPEELLNNNCLGLRADVQNNSGLFVTKMKLILEDCRGNVVFESKEGRSREKDFKDAWHEALRDAFTSVAELDHNYEADPVVETTNEVEEKAEEIADGAEETAENVTDEVEELVEEGEVAEVVEDAELDAAERFFTKDNAVFYLKEDNGNYAFYQKGMAEPFARLIRSDKGNTYIYNSLTKQGMAYFDENGNLVIEHFDSSQNKTVKTVYQLQD